MAFVRVLGWAFGIALGVPLFFAAVPYALAPVYEFPPPRSFAGTHWYNPYDVPSLSAWHVANFHAHSIAWRGLTNGHQPPAAVRAAYRQMGAQVIGVSNYHTVDSTGLDSTFIGSYEYGYSIPKTHRLALGAREVNWIDFVFGATTSQKQWVLDRLRPTTALSVINHPVMRHGHTVDDLRALGNYDLIEAMSSYGDSPAEWDAALSTGHAAWAIGSDDNHDITRTDILGRVWTMVLAPSTRSDAVLAALKHGSQFAVRGFGLHMDNEVRQVRMQGDTIAIVLVGAARRIRFVGDGGRELALARDVATAQYVAQPADSYVRIEVENAATTFWLNPMVRWDDSALAEPRPTVNTGATWLLRGALLLVLGALGALTNLLLRRRKPA